MKRAENTFRFCCESIVRQVLFYVSKYCENAHGAHTLSAYTKNNKDEAMQDEIRRFQNCDVLQSALQKHFIYSCHVVALSTF